MKQLTMKNKFWSIIIGGSIAAILLFSLPVGCKSVSKTQSNKSESITVSKSDSSSVNTYTVIDTTKTDSSTEITTYTITADSVDFYDYVPKGDYNVSPITTTPTLSYHIIKAKGVKITGTTKTQKAIVNKGETTQVVKVQNDVQSDSVVAKKETLNVTTKTAHPIKIIIGIGLLLFVIAGALYLYYKVYR